MELAFAMHDVEFGIVTKEHFLKLNLNRLNQQFLPVLELARLFIFNSSLQMTANKLETFSFVFDMNRLFEEFVYEFIRKHRKEILPEELKGCDIKSQYGKKYLAYSEDNKPVFKLQPDIVFIQKTDGSIPLIIDTKYKLLDIQERNIGISQSDMYQMFAYAKNFDCESIIILYPHREGIEEKAYKLEKDKKRCISIETIDIGIELSKNKQTLIMQLAEILGGKDEASNRQYYLEQ